NDQPIYLQVDPWAGLYLLKKGEKIEIVAESETTSPSFSVDEVDDTRILLIADSSEYYVVVDGQRIHWESYQLDRRLCPTCLGLLKSEDTSIRVCKCGRST